MSDHTRTLIQLIVETIGGIVMGAAGLVLGILITFVPATGITQWIDFPFAGLEGYESAIVIVDLLAVSAYAPLGVILAGIIVGHKGAAGTGFVVAAVGGLVTAALIAMIGPYAGVLLLIPILIGAVIGYRLEMQQKLTPH